MRILFFTALLAAPAWAETPMTGDEFQALVEGKTLTFAADSTPYGIEYYAPDRRVIWSAAEGECITGEWFEETTPTGPNICFVYEGNPEAQCWQVFDVDGKIRPDLMHRPGTTVLYEAIESEPLICGGVGT